MAVCCQNLPLGVLSSRSAPSVLVGELFKKFGLFLNTPCTTASPAFILTKPIDNNIAKFYSYIRVTFLSK